MIYGGMAKCIKEHRSIKEVYSVLLCCANQLSLSLLIRRSTFLPILLELN
jgi:hypothetical protein